MGKLLLLAGLFFSSVTFSQDSLRVMYYNLLNFPSGTPERADSLRKIINYSKPDVFLVNELETEVGADLILNSSMNVFGVNYYQRAVFVDGYDTDNMCFYNNQKLGFIDQVKIQTTLRDINGYHFYYKAPNLNAETDTIYMWFFSCHLKAGIGDYQQRDQEALQLKYYLNSISEDVENVFVGGDFNFYSGFEAGCQSLLNFGDVALYDPVDAIGNWSGEPAFAQHHTQSTRYGSVNGGAGGGMDDRFDLILVTGDVFDNSNGITYLNDSYQALGQDGNRYNDAINIPTNNSIPDSVANALYWVSDHLPVLMDIVFDETANITEKSTPGIQAYFRTDIRSILFSKNVSGEFELYDLSGKLMMSTYINAESSVQIPAHILNNLYIWRLVSDDEINTGKLFIR